MDRDDSEHGRRAPARPVAHRRDLTYQFPVYRWLTWLVIGGYVAGLGLMYLLAGMFGLPASLTWAFLVVVFCAGIALLERPKALLSAMMFYFLLMPSNRLLGLLGLPLPGFLDELFFVPFVAVIVMSWIQRTETPNGSWFPLAFIGVALVSWYVNGKPSTFTAVQVTLVTLKFFIIWHFCRLTCTFDDLRQFWRWGELYIHYGFVQFFYNCLWQQAPWPTRHPDNSGGVFGPEGTGTAHVVGYISILALFLLAAWWIGAGRKASKLKRGWMLFEGLVIAYNLVVMTDTKHGLLLMPLAFLPILFHPALPSRLRGVLLAGGGAVTLAALAFMNQTSSALDLRRTGRQFLDSPKGEAYQAVTRDFGYLVPYPAFGAGPGRFFSTQAAEAGAPLARRYVIPYQDEANRTKLLHTGGTRTGGSVLAWPQCGMLTLLGEFGWLGAGLYLVFVVWAFVKLWVKAHRARRQSDVVAVYLSLACGMVFLALTIAVASTETVGCLMFPWWMLIGRVWDMPVAETGAEALETPETPPGEGLGAGLSMGVEA